MARCAPRRGGAHSRAQPQAPPRLMSRASAAGVRKLGEQREQQAPRAGADVQDPKRTRQPAFRRGDLERGRDQRLAVGPGIERRRRDGEGAAVEIALAEDARYRLAAGAPGDAAAETFPPRARPAGRSGAREDLRQPDKPSTAASSRRASPPASSMPARAQLCRMPGAAARRRWFARRCRASGARIFAPSPRAGWPGGRRSARRSAHRAHCPPAPRRACAG